MFWIALISATAVSAEPVSILNVDPPLTQCVKSTLTWKGGVPPYTLGARVNIGSLRNIKAMINDTTLEWTCDFPAETQLELYVNDSSGRPGHTPTLKKSRETGLRGCGPIRTRSHVPYGGRRTPVSMVHRCRSLTPSQRQRHRVPPRPGQMVTLSKRGVHRPPLSQIPARLWAESLAAWSAS